MYIDNKTIASHFREAIRQTDKYAVATPDVIIHLHVGDITSTLSERFKMVTLDCNSLNKLLENDFTPSNLLRVSESIASLPSVVIGVEFGFIPATKTLRYVYCYLDDSVDIKQAHLVNRILNEVYWIESDYENLELPDISTLRGYQLIFRSSDYTTNINTHTEMLGARPTKETLKPIVGELIDTKPNYVFLGVRAEFTLSPGGLEERAYLIDFRISDEALNESPDHI